MAEIEKELKEQREIRVVSKTIRELLKGMKYSIDYYQREYKWQTKQVEELLNDLTNRFLEDHDDNNPREAVAGDYIAEADSRPNELQDLADSAAYWVVPQPVMT